MLYVVFAVLFGVSLWIAVRVSDHARAIEWSFRYRVLIDVTLSDDVRFPRKVELYERLFWTLDGAKYAIHDLPQPYRYSGLIVGTPRIERFANVRYNWHRGTWTEVA